MSEKKKEIKKVAETEKGSLSGSSEEESERKRDEIMVKILREMYRDIIREQAKTNNLFKGMNDEEINKFIENCMKSRATKGELLQRFVEGVLRAVDELANDLTTIFKEFQEKSMGFLDRRDELKREKGKEVK